MFKATDKLPSGEFSKIVSRLGGQDNAFTGHDATAYFQRVSKDRLPQVMAMEADRMVNLKLAEKEVLTERDVILEERRSRVENSPAAVLDEQMGAALYRNHTYGIPVIGWEHEIAGLTQHDAMDFYKAFYAPNNAILVVAGDVTVEQVKKLAEETFGPLKPSAAIKPRERVKEPPMRTPVRVELKDIRAGKATLQRYYMAPSYVTAAPGEAEALDLLMKIVGGGSTSRLYKKLVVTDQLASSAGGYYGGSGLDSTKISVYAVPAESIALEITENLLMSDPARSMDCLKQLREMGVRIVIDDFGTGYSSLSYLRRLPIDVLKIDRSFVAALTASRDDVIVRSTIDLAHNLGLTVTAEGVESDEQQTRLLELGCDAAQGTFIRAPAPAAAIRHWIGGQNLLGLM